MIARRACPLAIAALLLATALPAAACPGSAEGYGRLGGPEASIAVRFDPDAPKVGQFFGVDIVVCRAPAGETVQTVSVDALMPAHGHGMNYRPTVAQTGPGAFRANGLMLHMPGHWHVTFEIAQAERRTRLVLYVDLKS